MNKIAAIFELLLLGFVRRNFIGHHRWNGRESTNQLRQHISHKEYAHVFLFLSFGSKLDQKDCRNWSRKDRLTALKSQTMTFKSSDVCEKAVRCHKSEFFGGFYGRLFRNVSFKQCKSYKVDSFFGQLFCYFKIQRIVTGRYLVIVAVRCWKFRGGRP